MGCEILNRSVRVWGGGLACRLRRKMQAANARSAITAAPTPMPMPILAASVMPPGPASSAASDVAAAAVEEADDVELLTTLVGIAVELVGAGDDVKEVVSVVDVSDVSDVVEVSGTTLEDDSVGASVVDGAAAEVVWDVGTAAPGGSVAVAHIAEAAAVTVGAYPGGQSCSEQSFIELNQSGARHRQLKSMAAHANWPARLFALVMHCCPHPSRPSNWALAETASESTVKNRTPFMVAVSRRSSRKGTDV